jgi:transposase
VTDKMLLEFLAHGISISEISEVTGLHLSTIQRKIKKLKKKLADEFGEQDTGV